MKSRPIVVDECRRFTLAELTQLSQLGAASDDDTIRFTAVANDTLQRLGFWSVSVQIECNDFGTVTEYRIHFHNAAQWRTNRKKLINNFTIGDIMSKHKILASLPDAAVAVATYSSCRRAPRTLAFLIPFLQRTFSFR